MEPSRSTPFRDTSTSKHVNRVRCRIDTYFTYYVLCFWCYVSYVYGRLDCAIVVRRYLPRYLYCIQDAITIAVQHTVSSYTSSLENPP